MGWRSPSGTDSKTGRPTTDRREFLRRTPTPLAAACLGGLAFSQDDLEAEPPKTPLTRRAEAGDLADWSPKRGGFRFPAEWEAHERPLVALSPPNRYWHGGDITTEEVH